MTIKGSITITEIKEIISQHLKSQGLDITPNQIEIVYEYNNSEETHDVVGVEFPVSLPKGKD